VVLRSSDLPGDWTATRSGLSDALRAATPECAALDAGLVTNADASVAHDFTNAARRMTSSVVALPTRSRAVELVDLIADPATRPCLGTIATSAAGTAAATADVRPLAVAAVGDERRAAEIVTQGTPAGIPVTVYTDVVAFRIGRTAVLTVIESRGAPFTGDRDALLRAVAARLRDS
jgi:hypothetical protein